MPGPPVALAAGERSPDGVFGLFMIAAFRLGMGQVVGYQAPHGWLDGDESYQGLVEVAKRLIADTPEETSGRVLSVLRAFPTQPQLLRNHRFFFELMAACTPMLFPFLVGPAHTERWNHPSGGTWGTRVVIEKCRFLEVAECKGMCVGLCKQPTERFFNEDLGLPLAMLPNFEDGSCTMTWGEAPDPDALTDQDLACYATCSVRGAAAGAVAAKAHAGVGRGATQFAGPELVGPICPAATEGDVRA